MRIQQLRIQNYRSVENLELSLPHFYTAICGKNDAGKSNIIRALRVLFKTEDSPYWPEDDAELSLKDDFTRWKDKDDSSLSIFCQATLVIRPDDDEGLYRFLESYLQRSFSGSFNNGVEIDVGIRQANDGKKVAVRVGDQLLEELKAEEVLKKIKSSFAVLFHDSTEPFHAYRFLESAGLFRNIPAAEAKRLESAKGALERAWNKIAKRNQEDLSEVLGRLKDKYRIGLSMERGSDNREIPYRITLGADDINVGLENWGSGTQNRTRILMTLFKAKKIRDLETSASKITPVIIIEEPESYLHPSAQAEFGSILRDLAEEFKVQVIATTHSPYLLSLERPDANIFLTRTNGRKRSRETTLIDTTGDRWMEPFCLALGMSSDEIAPWRSVLFTSTNQVILVEGETDRDYLNLLRGEEHGENRFLFDGEIFPYEGKDSLKQKQLLRFIRARFKQFIVTYDLDVEKEVEQSLKDLGLVKLRDYLPIGKDAAGKRAIEGLLPEPVLQAVYSAHVELVQAATAGGAEGKSAKNRLKKLFFEEFKKTVFPSSEGYRHFYALARQLAKMLNPKSS